jgi:3-methyladenine DNA glycosylase/8-oxoguanine DNA glycosylase
VSPPRPSIRAAETTLATGDDVLAVLIARHGPCTLARRSGSTGRSGPAAADVYFAALAEAILYQQLAGKAAASIHRAFLANFDGAPTPEAVLALAPEKLRQAGLSGAKATAIVALARGVVAGDLPLERIQHLDDEEVVRRLTAVRGIGPWTAHMFCIFTLGRLDIWPTTDYGVRKGYALAYGLAEPPTPRALQELGDRFRPYRSVAAWYLWRAVEDKGLAASS